MKTMPLLTLLTLDGKRCLDVADIVAQFERHRALSSGVLSSRRQTSDLTRERQLLTLFLVRQSSINRRALAGCLWKNPSSISRWLNRAVELNAGDSEFQNQLAYLEAVLPKQG